MSADHYLPCLVRLALIRMRSLIMCNCCPNLWGLFHSVSTLVLSFECPVLSELHWEEFSCRTSRMLLRAYNVVYRECFYLFREKARPHKVVSSRNLFFSYSAGIDVQYILLMSCFHLVSIVINRRCSYCAFTKNYRNSITNFAARIELAS